MGLIREKGGGVNKGERKWRQQGEEGMGSVRGRGGGVKKGEGVGSVRGRGGGDMEGGRGRTLMLDLSSANEIQLTCPAIIS